MKSPDAPQELAQIPPVSPEHLLVLVNALSLALVSQSSLTSIVDIMTAANAFRIAVTKVGDPTDLAALHVQLVKLARAALPDIEVVIL